MISISEPCTGLPDIDNFEIRAVFPVNYEDLIAVSCSTGYVLDGDAVITCKWDRAYDYTNKPSCNLLRESSVSYA